MSGSLPGFRFLGSSTHSVRDGPSAGNAKRSPSTLPSPEATELPFSRAFPVFSFPSRGEACQSKERCIFMDLPWTLPYALSNPSLIRGCTRPVRGEYPLLYHGGHLAGRESIAGDPFAMCRQYQTSRAHPGAGCYVGHSADPGQFSWRVDSSLHGAISFSNSRVAIDRPEQLAARVSNILLATTRWPKSLACTPSL